MKILHIGEKPYLYHLSELFILFFEAGFLSKCIEGGYILVK